MTRPEPELDLEEAFRLVATDVRRNETSAQLSVVEAVAVAYDTVARDQLVDYGDRESAAWRLVLTRLARPATRAELAELVRKLGAEGYVELTTLEEYWAYRAQRGEL